MPSKNVVVLAFDGAQVLDIAGPMEVFSSANRYAVGAAYKVECVGAASSVVSMSNGLSLNVTPYHDYKGRIDTIIVPGGAEDVLQGLRSETHFISWLAAQIAKSRRIVSVCTGAFVLAELGVLDGRRISTHWAACDRLQSFVPSAVVDPDAIFTRDGHVYTSAGVSTGIDLALSLVEEDEGRDVSIKIARNLVLYLRRRGGQSQFSLPLDLQAADDSRLVGVAEYIANNVTADLTVNSLAGRFSLSARQCSRLFVSEFGMPPGEYVTKVRLDVVRVYLEETRLPLKSVAQKAGYRSQDSLSRAFRMQFGVTPDQYRSTFS